MSYNPNSSPIDNNIRNPLRGGYTTDSDQVWHGGSSGHLLTEELREIRDLINNVPAGRDTIVAAYALVPHGTQVTLPTGGQARGVVLTTAPTTTTSSVIIETTRPTLIAQRDIIVFFGYYKRRSDLTPVTDILWNASITLSSSDLIDTVSTRVSALETQGATQGQDISNIRAQQLTDEGRIDTLETTTSDQANSISDLQTKDSELETKDTELEAKDTEIEGNVSTLQTNQEALTTRVGAVETKNTEQDTSIESLQSADTVINTTLTRLQDEIDHINVNSLSPLNRSKLNLLRKIQVPIAGFTNFNFRAGTSGEWITENSFTQGDQNGTAQVRISSEILDTENPAVARIRHDRRLDGTLTVGTFLSTRGYNFITGQTQYGSFSDAERTKIINAGYPSVGWDQTSLTIFWITGTGSYPRKVAIANQILDIPGGLTVQTRDTLSFINFSSASSEARSQGSNGNWYTFFGANNNDEIHFNILDAARNWVFATSAVGSRQDLRMTFGQDVSTFGWASSRAVDFGLTVQGAVRDTSGRDQSALLEAYGFLAIAIQKPTSVQGIIQLYDFVDNFTRVKNIYMGSHTFSFSGNESVTPIGRSGLGFVALRIPVGTDLSFITDNATVDFNIQFPDDSYASESEYFYQDVPLVNPVEIDGEWAISNLELEAKDVVTIRFPDSLFMLRTRKEFLDFKNSDLVNREHVYEETKEILREGDGIFIENDDDTQSITINTAQLNITAFELGDIYQLNEWKALNLIKFSPLSSDIFAYNHRADTSDNPYGARISITDSGSVSQSRINFPSGFLSGQKTWHTGIAQILSLHSNPYGTPPQWTPAKRGGSNRFYGLFPINGFYGGDEGRGSLGSEENFNRFFASYYWFVIDDGFIQIGTRKNQWNYPNAFFIYGHYIKVPLGLPLRETSDRQNYYIQYEPLHDHRIDKNFTFSRVNEGGAFIFTAVPTNSADRTTFTGKGFASIRYYPGTVGDVSLREKYGVLYKAPQIVRDGKQVTDNNPPTRLFIEDTSYPLQLWNNGAVNTNGESLYITERTFESNLPVSGTQRLFDVLQTDSSYVFASFSQGWYSRLNFPPSGAVPFNIQRTVATRGDLQFVGVNFTPGQPSGTGAYTHSWGDALFLESGLASLTPTGRLAARSERSFTRVVNSFTFFAVDAATDTLQTIVSGNAERVGSSTTFGQTGVTSPRDVAYGDDKLFMIDAATDALYAFDATGIKTGGSTRIGSVQEFGIDEDNPTTLIYHRHNNKLYMIGLGRRFLIELNQSTGAGTQVGSVAAGFGHDLDAVSGGCTFDDDHLLIYDSDEHMAYLVAVADGTSTLWSDAARFGVPGEDRFSGFTNVNGDIYCIGQSTKKVYKLDLQRKIVHPISSVENFGLGDSVASDFWGMEAVQFQTTETVTVPEKSSNDFIAEIAFISNTYIGLKAAPTSSRQGVALLVSEDGGTPVRYGFNGGVTQTKITQSTRLYRYQFAGSNPRFSPGRTYNIDMEYSGGGHATSVYEDTVYTPANWLFNSNDILKLLYQGNGNMRYIQIQDNNAEVVDLGFQLVSSSDVPPNISGAQQLIPMATVRERQVALLEQKPGSMGGFVVSFPEGGETNGNLYKRTTVSSSFQYPSWREDDTWLFQQINPGWLMLVAKRNNTDDIFVIIYNVGTDNSVERKNEQKVELEDIKTTNDRSLLSLTRISKEKMLLMYEDNGDPASIRQSTITVTDFARGIVRLDHGGIFGTFSRGDTYAHTMIQRGVSNRYVWAYRPHNIHTLKSYEIVVDGLK